MLHHLHAWVHSILIFLDYITGVFALYVMVVNDCACQQHVHMLTAGFTPIIIIKVPYSS